MNTQQTANNVFEEHQEVNTEVFWGLGVGVFLLQFYFFFLNEENTKSKLS